MSDTPWTDDKENAATVYDQAGQPYEMLPFVLADDCRRFERKMRACLRVIENTTGSDEYKAMIRETLGLPKGDLV